MWHSAGLFCPWPLLLLPPLLPPCPNLGKVVRQEIPHCFYILQNFLRGNDVYVCMWLCSVSGADTLQAGTSTVCTLQACNERIMEKIITKVYTTIKHMGKFIKNLSTALLGNVELLEQQIFIKICWSFRQVPGFNTYIIQVETPLVTFSYVVLPSL